MRKKIVFLNGPPGCGKDHFGHVLHGKLGFARHKFASPITDAVRGMFNLTLDEVEACRGQGKDLPCDMFGGLTPRDVWISFSETWAKPVFGKKIFGYIAAEVARQSLMHRVCFTDCGFEPECEAVCEAVEGDKLLIRIHREGHTFEGDSRGYFDPSFCTSLDFLNRGVEDDDRRMLNTVLGWIKQGDE